MCLTCWENISLKHCQNLLTHILLMEALRFRLVEWPYCLASWASSILRRRHFEIIECVVCAALSWKLWRWTVCKGFAHRWSLFCEKLWVMTSLFSQWTHWEIVSFMICGLSAPLWCVLMLGNICNSILLVHWAWQLWKGGKYHSTVLWYSIFWL